MASNSDQDYLQELWQQGEEVEEKLQEAIALARSQQDNDREEYDKAVDEARKEQDDLLEEMTSQYKDAHEAAQDRIKLRNNEITRLKQENVEWKAKDELSKEQRKSLCKALALKQTESLNRAQALREALAAIEGHGQQGSSGDIDTERLSSFLENPPKKDNASLKVYVCGGNIDSHWRDGEIHASGKPRLLNEEPRDTYEPDRADMIIGRGREQQGPKCLNIPDHHGVSKQHALVYRKGLQYKILDLNSQKGTIVIDKDGKLQHLKGESAVLQDGAWIIISDHIIEVRLGKPKVPATTLHALRGL